MPTYEYACQACGHRFDAFQSLSAKVLRQCPACRRRRLERLISAGGGIIFKGSGFYITDYRGPGYQEAAKKDSEPPPKATDGKTDGKEGAKTDAPAPAAAGDGKAKASVDGAAKDGATKGDGVGSKPSPTPRAGSASKGSSKRSAGR